MNMQRAMSKTQDENGDEVNKLTLRLEELMHENDLILLDTSALFFGLEGCLEPHEVEAWRKRDKEAMKKICLPETLVKQSVEYNNFLAMIFRVGTKLRILNWGLKEYPTAKNRHIDQFGLQYIKQGIPRRFIISTECVEEALPNAVKKIPASERDKILKVIGHVFKDRKLSSADKDYLITSIIAARDEGDTALLTNDGGIVRAANRLRGLMSGKSAKKIIVPNYNWSVYTGHHSDSFKEMVSYKSRKK
jgi:hypothetical protein